jgi:hypothetical protein
MIDRGHKLPPSRQAALLQLGRGSLYYAPRPVPAGELAVMRRINGLHLNYPFAGARMLRDLLRAEDILIGREKVGKRSAFLSITHKSERVWRGPIARRESRVILCPAPNLGRCDGRRRGWLV